MASPICSTSRRGPLVRNGRMQTLMSNSRSVCARMGARCGTRSSIGTLETAFAAGVGCGGVAQPPNPTSPPSASEFFSRYRRSITPSPLRPIDELTPKGCDLATKGREGTMDRRAFFSVTGAGAAAAIPGTAAPRKARAGLPPLKARLGHQMNGKLTEANCKWASRYGLEALCASPDIKDPERLYPTVEELNQMLSMADKHGLKVEIIDSPLLQSTYIDREKHAAIMLGQSPERDHEIEAIQTTLKNCAAVGIRTLKYNLSILGVPRNAETVPGRGDTTYGKWNLKEGLAANLPLTRAGRVNENEYWERIEYFLARVVPVANQYKVRIACHPEDPGMPPEGFQGIQNPLCAVSGLKKFVALHESPYHGLNFCQGTI